MQPFGVMGPTKEQEKAMQNAGPSQGMKDLERAVAACKGDQQCLQRVAQGAAAAPPTGPNGTGGSIQPWYARSCSGSFKVEDQFVATDPGGEGGGGAYKETRTVSGQNIIPEGGEDGWHGAFMDHDVAKGTTSYYFTTISPMTFDMLSVRTGYGAGTKQTKQPVAFYEGMLPTPFAVLPYPPAQGKASHPVSGGTLTVEWKIRK